MWRGLSRGLVALRPRCATPSRDLSVLALRWFLKVADRRGEHGGLVPCRRLLRLYQHQRNEFVIVQTDRLYQDGSLAPAVIRENAKRHEAVAACVPEHDIDELTPARRGRG